MDKLFVIVMSDNQGNVIGISQNNSEYGYVRVEQKRVQFKEGGWLALPTLSALIKGKTDDLKAIGFVAGMQIPGKIIIKESLTPINPEDATKHIKMAGETGIVCTLDDQPIYRETYFTMKQDAEDELIQHDNKDEIVTALEKLKTKENKTAVQL